MAKRSYHHGDLKKALIRAGIEILSKEGTNSFSLRKAARAAGVSHSAPYAHFADKRALIAAISTEGYKALHERILAAIEWAGGDPLRRLAAAAWAYVSFAIDEPEHFRITLAGVVERERDFPEYVEAAQKSFALVVRVVEEARTVGLLQGGVARLAALTLWGSVHGLVALYLDGQISHTLLDRYGMRRLLLASLGQLTGRRLSVRLLPPDRVDKA